MRRHESVSEETERVLIATLQLIEQHKDQLEMDFWFTENQEEALTEAFWAIQLLTKCYTMGCLASWICAAHPRDCFGSSMKWEAMEIAQLSDLQAQLLFHRDEWPSEFYKQYVSNGSEGRFIALKERVEYFIQAGE